VKCRSFLWLCCTVRFAVNLVVMSVLVLVDWFDEAPMDVAPVASEPTPWQSAAAPASSADVFAVGVSSTTVTAGSDDSWAHFGSDVTSSSAAAPSSEDDDSGWADFASFDSSQSQCCSTR